MTLRRPATHVFIILVGTLLAPTGCRQLAAYDRAAEPKADAARDAQRPPDGTPLPDMTSFPDRAKLPDEASVDGKTDEGAADGRMDADAAGDQGGDGLGDLSFEGIPTDPACTCARADVNGDGFVTPKDVLIVANCLSGTGDAGICPPAGDCNNDGNVTNADMFAINALVQSGKCGGSVHACAPTSGGTTSVPYQHDMWRCQGTSLFDQCAAHSYCNEAAGWHLCTASEYLARGGKAKPGGGPLAWIAGCVRDSAGVVAPRDGLCDASCKQTLAGTPTYRWDCTGGNPIPTSTVNLGIGTASACFRLGVDDPANAAFWDAPGVHQKRNAALCCR